MVIDHILESFVNDSSLDGLMVFNQKIIQDLTTIKNDSNVSLDVKELCINTISLFENTHHSIYMYHQSLCFAMAHLNKSVHSFKTNFEIDRNSQRIELFLRTCMNTLKDLPKQCTDLLNEFQSSIQQSRSNVLFMMQLINQQWDTQDQLSSAPPLQVANQSYISSFYRKAFQMINNSNGNSSGGGVNSLVQQQRNRLQEHVREILNYSTTDRALKEMEGQRDHLVNVNIYLSKLFKKTQIADPTWFMEQVEKFWPDIEMICLVLESVDKSFSSKNFPVFPFKTSSITCL